MSIYKPLEAAVINVLKIQGLFFKGFYKKMAVYQGSLHYNTSAMMASTMNSMTNQRAIVIDMPAIPLNPNTAAMMASMTKVTAQLSRPAILIN